MMENNVPTTNVEENEEILEPTIVEGIDITKYGDEVTKADVETFTENAKSLTRLEIIREMKRISYLIKNVVMVRGLAQSAKNNTDVVETFSNTMMSFISGETSNEEIPEAENNNQSLTEIKTSIEDIKTADEFDYDKAEAELVKYESQLEVALEILHNRYTELKNQGNTTIADDIIETLLKNRSTLEQTESLNSEMYIEYIDNAIEELQSHSIARMFPKVEVPKKTLGIIKDFFKDIDRSIKEISRCGLSVTWIRNFADFMWEEQSFACKNDETTFSKGTYATVALIFFYHITKIVGSELKKQNYLSLVFKYYILQILEIQSTTHMNEDQRFDENDEEIEVSKMRSAVFADYHKLFMMYITADIDKKLMIKNSAKLEAAVDRFIHPPRKKPAHS